MPCDGGFYSLIPSIINHALDRLILFDFEDIQKTLVFVSSIMICSGNISAADPKNRNAPRILWLEHIETSVKFFEILLPILQSGTLTLANGDIGKVSAPCADFGNAQKELWFDLDVRCTFTMDDGSHLYIFYGEKYMDDKATQLMDDMEAKILIIG